MTPGTDALTERTETLPAAGSSALPLGHLDASVIVCTFNRAYSLKETLAALAAQQVRTDIRWELIVVDNNSSDHTRSVVEDAKATLGIPLLHYEFEAKQGLSHARNHGIARSAGEILLFTDDDVCPEPDWLQKILDDMNRHDCDACGGYIAPVWEVPPPKWLTERFYGFLAIRMDDTSSREITQVGDAPFGANMAFRRSLLDRVGPFDTTRGRVGKVLASGEDGDMFERVLSAGAKVMYFGDARVHHKVEAFRLTKRYFRRWRYQTSRNIAQSRDIAGDRRLLGIPPYLIPQLLRAGYNAIVATMRLPEDEALHRQIIFWHFVGVINGLLRRRFVGEPGRPRSH